MYRIEMAFGHMDCNGLTVSSEQITRAENLALRAFTMQFHGAQLYRHPGGYHGDDSRVIMEPSTTVWAYSPDAEPLVAPLSDAAREIAAILHQESVLVVIIELQGRMYWVRLEPSGVREQKRRFDLAA